MSEDPGTILRSLNETAEQSLPLPVASESARPPLASWQFAVLMIATATLYQFVWLHSAASELRRSRDSSITPWHWVAIPFLGPFSAIAWHHLATYLRNWREDEAAEEGHMAEPILVAFLAAVAYLPIPMVLLDMLDLAATLPTIVLLLSLPHLILHNQLKLIKWQSQESSARGLCSNMTGRQLAITVIGAAIVGPLGVVGINASLKATSGSGLAVNEIVRRDDRPYQVRVPVEGWSRIEPGYFSDESDMEFMGPDEQTWALIYHSPGISVDEALSFRLGTIEDEFSKAKCTQKKVLIDESMHVRGLMDCSGRNAVDGLYAWVSRVVAGEDDLVEIVAFTSHRNTSGHERLVALIGQFADGLELIE